MKTIKIGAIVLAFLLVITMLPMNSLSATSSGEIQNQINQLKKEKAEIESQIEQIQGQYNETYDEISNILSKRNVVDQEIQLLHEEILNINEQIMAYNTLIADKQEELDKATKEFEELREASKRRIRAMEEQGKISYWTVIFKANSFADLLDRCHMIQEIAAADKVLLDKLNAAANEIKSAQEQLKAGKNELALTKQELDTKLLEMEEKRIESENLIQELLNTADNLEDLMADFEQKEQDFLNEIAAKENEFDEAKKKELEAYMSTYAPPTTTPPQPTPTIPPENNNQDSSLPENNTQDTILPENDKQEEKPSEDEIQNEDSSEDEVQDMEPSDEDSQPTVVTSWITPCSYILLTSPFGYREAPTAGASTYHQGVDLAGPTGTPIVAASSGVVADAGYNSSAGNYVKITHSDGYSSIYMHLQTIDVSAGTTIGQGEQIGTMGSTGVSTGPHLHFGITKDGVYVNPALYIPL